MATKVITGKCRASFVHIFEPQSVNGSDPKYSLSLIIPKSDTKTVAAIKDAIEEAIQNGIANKWGGKRPNTLKLPLRDGDVDREDDEAYKNAFFVNATSQEKPGVVDRRRIPITDPLTVYSGCYVRASVNFYPFNVNGNKGVSAGLSNVQFWSDGEPLTGRVRAEDEFDALDADDDEDFLD
ncbi:MAG: DUF2815 family protein [Clostridia bacterium]|nr:DUF2815 family protein [Clostridia bacterium]